jgi:YegS/Rv2252/BmrU family lipid kinase
MIVYNPLAGPADLQNTIQQVARFWQSRGWQVTLHATQYRGHATTLAAQAATDGYDLVLAGGGDGTLGEVADGLAMTETILGLLPMGTGNSFAKELHMPRPGLLDHRGLVESSAMLASGRVYAMDMGRNADGRYWLLWAGAGLDGFLVERMEPRPKRLKRLGAFGYALQALTLLPQFDGMRATVWVDDQQVSGDFSMVTVCNCRYFAGGMIELNPDAALDDGIFDIWLVRRKSTLGVARLMLAVRSGRRDEHPDLMVLSGRSIRIETAEPVPIHTDGDPGGTTPFSCEVVPAALRVLIPASTPLGLFQRPGLYLQGALEGAQGLSAGEQSPKRKVP